MKKFILFWQSLLIIHLKQLTKIMKLSVFIMFATTLTLLANKTEAQNSVVNFENGNISVGQLINGIETQTDYLVIYSNSEIDVEREVTLKKTENKVSSYLEEVFGDVGIDYEFDNNYIILAKEKVSKNLFSSTPSQQQNVVTGKVIDNTGEGIPGVNVTVKGTTIGVMTDMDGNFSINVPDNNSILTFSFIGFTPQEVTIGDQRVINITLSEDAQLLEEVVVVGYGVQKKSVVTGAISSINSVDISNTSVTRPEQALQGKTAGVQIISTSGAPGSDMKVRIRGYSSNGTADPLYIVDGVKTSSISGIDPNDISNMEVLKDAASAAIYGAEGGNGVIIITTKRGNSGTGTINYEYQYTMQNVGKLPDMLDATEYATYYNEAGTFNIDLATIENNTNWLKSIFEPSAISKHYISFNSGTEKSNLLISISSLNQDGIIVGDKDKFKRYTFRMNADNQVTKWLKVGNNVSFAITKRNAIIEDNEITGVVSCALRMDPLTPIYYEDGAIAPNAQALLDLGKKLVQDEEGHYYGVSNYVTKNPNNPFVTLANTHAVENNSFLQGSLFAEITPAKNIVYTSRFGYEFSNSNTSSWVPRYYYNAIGYNDVNSVSENLNIGAYWLWENFVNYTNSFGDHNISALLGMSAESRSLKNVSASGGPMLVEDDPNFAQLSYIVSQTQDVVSGSSTLNKKSLIFWKSEL